MEKASKKSSRTGNFVLGERQELFEDLTVKKGSLTLHDYAAIFSQVIVERGDVSLGDYAFINELHMPYGGHIFFCGKRPVIRHLEATSLTVHLPKNYCGIWTDFVQINNAQNIIIRRDLD